MSIVLIQIQDFFGPAFFGIFHIVILILLNMLIALLVHSYEVIAVRSSCLCEIRATRNHLHVPYIFCDHRQMPSANGNMTKQSGSYSTSVTLARNRLPSTLYRRIVSLSTWNQGSTQGRKNRSDGNRTIFLKANMRWHSKCNCLERKFYVSMYCMKTFAPYFQKLLKRLKNRYMNKLNEKLKMFDRKTCETKKHVGTFQKETTANGSSCTDALFDRSKSVWSTSLYMYMYLERSQLTCNMHNYVCVYIYAISTCASTLHLNCSVLYSHVNQCS